MYLFYFYLEQIIIYRFLIITVQLFFYFGQKDIVIIFESERDKKIRIRIKKNRKLIINLDIRFSTSNKESVNGYYTIKEREKKKNKPW